MTTGSVNVKQRTAGAASMHASRTSTVCLREWLSVGKSMWNALRIPSHIRCHLLRGMYSASSLSSSEAVVEGDAGVRNMAGTGWAGLELK